MPIIRLMPATSKLTIKVIIARYRRPSPIRVITTIIHAHFQRFYYKYPTGKPTLRNCFPLLAFLQ